MSLDAVPLWAFFFGTIAVILLSVESGFELGRARARRSQDEKESPAAAMGGAVLGLVAFMLAFTFSIGAGRFDARKELVRTDANVIGTAWLRADFLPDQPRAEAKRLLREYLELRLNAAEAMDVTRVRAAVDDSSDLQRRLWAIAVANGKKDMNSDVGALFIDSLNAVFDTHATRVAIAVDTRIPLGMWLVLYTLTALGMMATGYHTGLTGSRRARSSVLLATAFAMVISLIAALDRPNTPFVSVTQKPLRDLLTFIDETPAPQAPGKP